MCFPRMYGKSLTGMRITLFPAIAKALHTVESHAHNVAIMLMRAEGFSHTRSSRNLETGGKGVDTQAGPG